MNLNDFLSKQSKAMKCQRIGFEFEILEHFDACVIQAALGQYAAVVSSLDYRDYAERRLMSSLSLHGVDASCCLCIQGVDSFEDQIQNAIAARATTPSGVIVSLGNEALFRAARAAAAKTGIKSIIAVVDELPSRCFFIERPDEADCAVHAVYFDIARIQKMTPGNWRELTAGIELYANAFLAEADVADALAMPEAGNVRHAIAEIEPCWGASQNDPDAVAQLCEACAWLSAARIALGYDASLDFVMRYAAASPQSVPMPVQDHAAILLRICDALTQVESLEIDADDCANHQLPKDILQRTLKQTLLEDEIDFSWLKAADEAWTDRMTTRALVHTILANWDTLCEQLGIRSAMLHAALEDRPASSDASSLAGLWIHASRFAPRTALVHIAETLRRLDGALYE